MKTEKAFSTIKTYDKFFEFIKIGAKLVIYEDQVIDITSFYKKHPGGINNLENYIGREIGRFIYGNHKTLNSNYHSHLGPAFSVMKENTVAVLENPLKFSLFIPQNGKTINDLETSIWKIVSFDPISGRVKLHSNEFKVAGMLPYFQHAGKYIKLHFKGLNESRNYGLIFSKSSNILPLILKFIESFQQDSEFAPIFPDINNIIVDDLELIIKKGNRVSKMLYENQLPSNEFLVSGPFGPGLQIAPDQKGIIMGVTCGIGGHLFLEVIMYILRMNIYRAGKLRGKSYKFVANEEFNRLNDPSFKLIFFTSLKSKESIPCHEILLFLDKLSKEYKFNNFEYVYRFSSEKTPKWTEETFKPYVNPQVSKVIIYGPLGVEDQLKIELRKAGFQDYHFHFL